MGGINMTLTLGVVLEHARERGLRVDVETATGRVYQGVRVAALEQFCVVLLDDLPQSDSDSRWGTKDRAADSRGRAHIVAREHLAAVSLDRSAFLEIEPHTVDLRKDPVGEAAFAV